MMRIDVQEDLQCHNVLLSLVLMQQHYETEPSLKAHWAQKADLLS